MLKSLIVTLQLKRLKGQFLLLKEVKAVVFIESSEIIAPSLCTLFNYMYSNNVYPSVWAKGVIVPVPKKRDPNNVNNYRGSTLTSIFSKIFSIRLENRLRVWSESNNSLSDFQFGFRISKSTVDCIFVLSSTIDKVINHEKKSFTALS